MPPIVNHEKNHRATGEGVDKMILIGKDINGWNSGVFILKGGQESKDWLEFVFNRHTIKSKIHREPGMQLAETVS